MKIKRADVIGFTKAPDGKHYLNLRGFRQVEVTAAQWQKFGTDIPDSEGRLNARQ